MISTPYLIYLFTLAFVLAVIEIQIEGRHGWAALLPTWRPAENKWYAKFYRRIMAGKQLTGYHLSVFIFVLLLLHFPFFVGLKWSRGEELRVLSLFFLFDVIWDFLWFILNPHYTLKKFKKEYIEWHHRWIGPLPLDYYTGIFLSFLFYLPLSLNNPNIILEWFKIFSIFFVLTLIVVLVSMTVRLVREK